MKYDHAQSWNSFLRQQMLSSCLWRFETTLKYSLPSPDVARDSVNKKTLLQYRSVQGHQSIKILFPSFVTLHVCLQPPLLNEHSLISIMLFLNMIIKQYLSLIYMSFYHHVTTISSTYGINELFVSVVLYTCLLAHTGNKINCIAHILFNIHSDNLLLCLYIFADILHC